MNRLDITLIQYITSRQKVSNVVFFILWRNNIQIHILEYFVDVQYIPCCKEKKMHCSSTRIINMACYFCRKHLSSHWHFEPLKEMMMNWSKRSFETMYFVAVSSSFSSTISNSSSQKHNIFLDTEYLIIPLQ